MAEVTTSGRVIQKPEIVLEVDDFLPPGLIGVRHKTAEEAGISAESFEDVPFEESEFVETSQYDELPIPDEMIVVSQTVRIGPDRKTYVDVVIEVPDMPGANEFEARVTAE